MPKDKEASAYTSFVVVSYPKTFNLRQIFRFHLWKQEEICFKTPNFLICCYLNSGTFHLQQSAVMKIWCTPLNNHLSNEMQVCKSLVIPKYSLRSGCKFLIFFNIHWFQFYSKSYGSWGSLKNTHLLESHKTRSSPSLWKKKIIISPSLELKEFKRQTSAGVVCVNNHIYLNKISSEYFLPHDFQIPLLSTKMLH